MLNQDAGLLKQSDPWDHFLQASRPDIGYLQSSWWADFRVSRGWGHFGVTFKDAQGIIGGARILTHAYAPGACFYYVPEGPVLPDDKEDAAQVFQEVIAYVDRKRKEESHVVSHLRLETRWAHQPDFVRGCRVASSYFEPRNTLCVDLRPAESAILAQMKPKGRYNIGVARRNGVSVIEDRSPTGLAEFSKIYDETFVRHGLEGNSTRYFSTLMRRLIAVDCGTIFFAKYRDEILGAALVVYFGNRATYFYGGSRLSHRRVMAPYLLHFEAMLKAKALGYSWYDFYGVAPQNDPNHRWANFSSFKRKFGGCEMSFIPALDFVYDRDAYQNFRKQNS